MTTDIFEATTSVTYKYPILAPSGVYYESESEKQRLEYVVSGYVGDESECGYKRACNYTGYGQSGSASTVKDIAFDYFMWPLILTGVEGWAAGFTGILEWNVRIEFYCAAYTLDPDLTLQDTGVPYSWIEKDGEFIDKQDEFEFIPGEFNLPIVFKFRTPLNVHEQCYGHGFAHAACHLDYDRTFDSKYIVPGASASSSLTLTQKSLAVAGMFSTSIDSPEGSGVAPYAGVTPGQGTTVGELFISGIDWRLTNTRDSTLEGAIQQFISDCKTIVKEALSGEGTKDYFLWPEYHMDPVTADTPLALTFFPTTYRYDHPDMLPGINNINPKRFSITPIAKRAVARTRVLAS